MTLYWCVLVGFLIIRARVQKEDLTWLAASRLTMKNILVSQDPYHYICGFTGAAHLVLQTFAVLNSKGGMASVFSSGAMIILALIKMIKDKHFPMAQMAIICLGTVGMVLLAKGGFSLGEQRGMIIGISCLLCFSISLYASDKRAARSEKHGHQMLESWALIGVITSIVLLPQLILAGVPQLTDVMRILTLGIITTALSDILFAWAVRKGLDMVKAFFITRITLVLSPLWIGLSLKEVPTGWSILGGIILLLAVILEGLRKEQKKEVPIQEVIEAA